MFYRWLFLFSCVFFNFFAMEQDSGPALTKELTKGFVAGWVEPYFPSGAPLLNAKNDAQVNGPGSLKRLLVRGKTNPLSLWTGVKPIATFHGGSSCLQRLANEYYGWIFQKHCNINQDSTLGKFSSAGAAGATSALFAGPGERLFYIQNLLQKQGNPCTLKDAYKFLLKHESSHFAPLKSFWLVASRDGPWAIAWIAMVGTGKEKLDVLSPSTKGFNVLLSGMLTGAVVSICTHVQDTVKTNMQADINNKKYKSVSDAFYQLGIHKGTFYWKTFFKNGFRGIEWRATRAMAAVTIMYAASDLVEKAWPK